MVSVNPWPDYEKSPVEVTEELIFEVFDPWTAQIVGIFYKKEHAEWFAKLYAKKTQFKGGI